MWVISCQDVKKTEGKMGGFIVGSCMKLWWFSDTNLELVENFATLVGSFNHTLLVNTLHSDHPFANTRFTTD